nr:hypothetical protein [Tanacetum cinerariifolium]
MRTRSSSNLPDVSSNPSTSNPKRCNRRRSKQPFILEESPIDTMADQRTMEELLRVPTEGYAEAIVVPSILTDQFELKHNLINMMTTNQFFGLEKDNPHDQIRWFNKITSTIKYKDVPNSTIKLMLFPFFLTGAALQWLEKEPPRSIYTWEDLDRYKDLLRACPHYGFTELHQLDTFYNALNTADQDSLNVAACEIAKLTHAVNQQTSAVTTAMTAILKQFQATPPPASIKAVEEICVTCGGAHPYYQCLAAGGNTFPKLRYNIQGYVLAAAVNYNQGNSVYRAPCMANQIRPPGFAQPNVQNNQNWFGQPQGFNHGNNFSPEQSYQAPTQQNQNVPLNELKKVKRMNEANMKAMQTQINMVKNELRNEMKNLIQASLSNQTNEIKNIMASLLQMSTASTSGSGSLPSNTIANPKGELKSITTQSGLVLDGPTVPTPPPFINPEEDERVEETLTNPNLAEYTIKVPPPSVQKYKPASQREYVVYQRDPLHPNIPYPSRMLKQKQQEKYEKKLPEKLRDPRKFLIPCGFNELKCKALANLGASINLMPLSVWKKLGLPELISTRMTLELANRAICTPVGIARDVFISVGRFTFLADFVIVDYESDPRVPLILGRPFLRTARALIDVHVPLILLLSNCLRSSPMSSLLSHFLRKFDVESDLKEIDFLLHQDTGSSLNDLIDQSNLANPADIFVDSMPEMFTDKHALDYSSPLIFDEYDDDFLEVESDTKNIYDYPFDSKGERIKESKLLIDELDLPCDFLPSEYDSFISQDFSSVDALPSTNNEDEVFNPGILIQEKPVKIITLVVQDKKLEISNASLVLEDFDHPLYEPLFFKEVP